MPELTEEEKRIILEYVRKLKAYLQSAVKATAKIELTLQNKSSEPTLKKPGKK